MNRCSDFFTDLVSVCGAHEKDIFAVLGDEVCTEDSLRFLYDLYKKGYELGEADKRPYGIYGSDLEKVEEAEAAYKNEIEKQKETVKELEAYLIEIDKERCITPLDVREALREVCGWEV